MLRAALLLSLFACGTQDAKEPAKADAPAAAASTSTNADDPAADKVIATWTGGQMTYAQLMEKVGAELASMDADHRVSRYEFQTNAMERAIDELLLEAEVKKAGVADIEALLKKEIEEKVPTPSEDAIKAELPKFQERAPGIDLESARPYIERQLREGALQAKYQEYMTALRAAAGVKKDFPYPNVPRAEVPVDDTDPVLGAKDAPVTIVQFAEYQCYYCNKVRPTLDELMKKYEGKVRLVFKDYPLPSHDRAMPAAQAAHCAGEQGKYWDINARMLENQGALGDEDLKRHATELGLDVAKFEECRTSGKYAAKVEASMKDAQKVGVQATPTFLVNGLKVSGAQPIERFSAIIDRELEAKSN